MSLSIDISHDWRWAYSSIDLATVFRCVQGDTDFLWSLPSGNQTWLAGKSRTEWRFLARKITDFNGPFSNKPWKTTKRVSGFMGFVLWDNHGLFHLTTHFLRPLITKDSAETLL